MRETEGLEGTSVRELVEALDHIYEEIAAGQRDWKEASPFRCPDGCGACCVDFEPDVLESEALYLAVWMLFNQRERAESILDGSFVSPRRSRIMSTPDDVAMSAALSAAMSAAPGVSTGCFLFDPDSPWHCTVYGGRCLICRLFGYSGDRGKDGRPRWKPCKFYPFDNLSVDRQYNEDELRAIFGSVPPAMGDFASRVMALSPDSAHNRRPLREALPEAISKILMVRRFSGQPD
jgi:uncharacterized protein